MTAGLAWHEFDTPYAEATNSATLMRCAFDPNRYVLELQTVARPGEIWNYNSGTSGLIGTILARAVDGCVNPHINGGQDSGPRCCDRT
jgi:CubicO group peptidase (beta-lactamase class C family)